MDASGPKHTEAYASCSSESQSDGSTTSSIHNRLVDSLPNEVSGAAAHSALKFKMIWRNLCFTTPPTAMTRLEKSVLCRSKLPSIEPTLKTMSGSISSGTTTALMGPSGAGKSTLLNCLSRKLRRGVTGEITLSFEKQEDTLREIRIGFVPQDDFLFGHFTVHESLLFASKMMNGNSNHRELTATIIESLHMSNEALKKVSKLSGGQRKRVSIAVELISQPHILFLDEPTSGLDSYNALNVVKLLQTLKEDVTQSPAIVATIHQPSFEVFALFDQIYLLAKHGYNIYSGRPAAMSDYLTERGFIFLFSQYSNSADFMIEVAAGTIQPVSFTAVAESHENQFPLMAEECIVKNTLPAEEFEVLLQKAKMKKSKSNFMILVFYLFSRSFQATILPITCKALMGMVICLVLAMLDSRPIGDYDGCYKSFNASDPEAETENVTRATMFSFAFTTYCMFFYGVAAVMIFPKEFRVVCKEISNTWYPVSTYLISSTLLEILSLCLCSFLSAVIFLNFSHQHLTVDRFFLFLAITFLLSASWESRAAICGILFSPLVALIVTIGLMFPVLFFSGMIVKEAKIWVLLKPLTVLSDMKYGTEALHIILYGLKRCAPVPGHEDQPSRMLSFNDLDDSNLNARFIYVIVSYFISKIAACTTIFFMSRVDRL